VKENNTYTHHYYLKDHLGSNRIAMNSSGTVVQVNNYYPSGTTMAELPRRTDQGVQPYKYNGKELDRTNGLDFYDYEARMYDPVLMRFTTIDPMAEKYYAISPLAYCANNPVNMKDPDGRFPVWAVVGAALDYGFQVYDNYQNGNTGYDAWVGNVDFVDVALSAVNPTGKFKVVGTLAIEATKAAVDISANKGVKVETDVKKVATDAVINTAVNVGAGKVIDKAGSDKAVKTANKEVSAANQQVKTAERQAQRSPNSTKAAEKAKTAQSNAQTARNKQVATQMLNSTSNAAKQAVNTTTERIRKEDEKNR
jgi:RHS repeat-associated protein